VRVDPHTAVAVAAGAEIAENAGANPMVALAISDPAKFPDAMERATGLRRSAQPADAENIDKPEEVTLPRNDVGAVAPFAHAHARRTHSNPRGLRAQLSADRR